MELLFESRTNLSGMSGDLRFFQRQPEVHPELVMVPELASESRGLTHYGTVLNDRGRLRMWYLVFDNDFPPHTLGGSAAVAYAESQDGYSWKRPHLELAKEAPQPNNLTNLGLHSATVFTDPRAAESHVYRAVGCGRPEYHRSNPGVTTRGYFTAHSADGLDWKLDTGEPRWKSIDVVTTTWHPERREGIVAMKYTPTVKGIARRSIHTATYRDGAYSQALPALYADDFEDICAAQRGFETCDYYGMAMLPAGKGLVGFLWKFWHQMPYGTGWGNGPQALYGLSEVSLVYQPEAGSCWFHLPGRQAFISRDQTPWPNGWFYTGSSPVMVGDEQRLYFSGREHGHGYGRNRDWSAGAESDGTFANAGITFAKWPAWRLFGFEAQDKATLRINLGEIRIPSNLALNYEVTKSDGYVRARLMSNGEDRGHAAKVLQGDSISAPLVWGNSSNIAPMQNAQVELEFFNAKIYAYSLQVNHA